MAKKKKRGGKKKKGGKRGKSAAMTLSATPGQVNAFMTLIMVESRGKSIAMYQDFIKKCQLQNIKLASNLQKIQKIQYGTIQQLLQNTDEMSIQFATLASIDPKRGIPILEDDQTIIGQRELILELFQRIDGIQSKLDYFEDTKVFVADGKIVTLMKEIELLSSEALPRVKEEHKVNIVELELKHERGIEKIDIRAVQHAKNTTFTASQDIMGKMSDSSVRIAFKNDKLKRHLAKLEEESISLQEKIADLEMEIAEEMADGIQVDYNFLYGGDVMQDYRIEEVADDQAALEKHIFDYHEAEGKSLAEIAAQCASLTVADECSSAETGESSSESDEDDGPMRNDSWKAYTYAGDKISVPEIIRVERTKLQTTDDFIRVIGRRAKPIELDLGHGNFFNALEL